MIYPIRKLLKAFFISLTVTVGLTGINLNAYAHTTDCETALMKVEIDYAQRSTYESDGSLSHKLFNTQEHCSELQAHIDCVNAALEAVEKNEVTDKTEELNKRKTQNFDDNEMAKPSTADEWEEWRWEGKD